MAFQFTISPGAPKPKTVSKRSNEKTEEIACLSLAPFTPNVKMCFENIIIGTTCTQKLLLENPSSKDIEVSIKNLPLPEQQVKLDWYDHIIPAESTVILEITWSPITEEAWRHTFSFEICRNETKPQHIALKTLKKDVAVSFKSISAKKTKPKKSTRPGKYTVISKKIKTPPKKMFPPKTSLYKHTTFLGKQTSSPKQKDIVSNRTYGKTLNEYYNKENLNPCLRSKSALQLGCNRNDGFKSPSNASFNIESANNDIRRSTYTVKALNSNVQKYVKEDVYNDSLEGSPSSKHSTTSLCNYEISEHISKKSTTVLYSFNATPVLTNVNLIKSKLDSSTFTFTPVKPAANEFIPNICSTIYRSNNSDTKKQISFAESKCDIETKIPEIAIHDESLGNISSETYIKGNISSETYVKGNISSETYTINGNLSSGTYVKDNSTDNVINSEILPQYSKNMLTPLRNVSPLFEESLSDIDCTILSPIVKDKSVVHQASMSGENARSIIEANLWCNDKNKCLSFINELEESNNVNKSLKRKSTSVINVSPPKKLVLDGSKHTSDHFFNLKWNKSKPVQVKQILRRSIEYLDPFMTASLYHDKQWMEEQEIRFQKWLNALLTPPAELDSDIDVHPVDVAKLWQQCKNKAVPMAPSKEAISNKYHTNKRLDALRKAANDLFKSRELSEILIKTQQIVESEKLSIRKDKDVHLDLGLQSEVMTLFLSYNPLWLRIGLETIYGVTIQLSSNSDIMGLSSFIMHRFFKDPYLVKKYKTVHSPKYIIDIKKFILKKFLTLVYFLDVAKSKVLIAHDPCLFCKNAPVKESREILLIFSKELLSAVGDVTKFLRFTGYVVSHKQRYIHEFDYSVVYLGTDLRDGVRLTKVMEIILMVTGLTDNLRVPAISRLQKIHNMKIVFEALQQANFEIVGDIFPKDIVDGHHEKTLSFLWQIIYKFQAPRFIKASTTIQMWWRSLKIVIRRRILFKTKSAAVRTIQSWYRRQKMAQKLLILAPIIKDYLKRNSLERNAVKIQSYYRMVIQRRSYIKLKQLTICLQKYSRGYLVRRSIQKKTYASIKIQAFVRMCILKSQYCKLRASAIHIQQIYRAKRLMLIEQDRYVKLKYHTIFIQRLFRANREMKVARENFIELKAAAITIQKRFQATKKMKTERARYITQKTAALVIQAHFRALKQMKLEQNYYQNLRNATICIQQHFRAYRLMKIEYSNYQNLKRSTITIQQQFRATLKMKMEYEYFRKLKEITIIVQRCYRAKRAMIIENTKFKNIRNAAITIQRKYRANRAAKIEYINFQTLKATTINIQRKFRANQLMKIEYNRFQLLKKSTIVIQRRYRANQAMKYEQARFNNLKKAAKIIQAKFRANQLMQIERKRYLEIKQATINIQMRLRALRALRTMKIEWDKFKNLKKATIIIQRRFRANQAMKYEQTHFNNLKKAASIIQAKFRANQLMKIEHKRYLELKQATTNIQMRFRALRALKIEWGKFKDLKKATIVIQRQYRANQTMKYEQTRFNNFKKAANIIQAKFRANQLMKIERKRYLELKQATIDIQIRFRALRAMKIECIKFRNLKKTTIVIQRRFRANQAMRHEQNHFNNLKKVTKIIQTRFRANKQMKIEVAKFQETRNAAIILQRRFRAKKAMKIDRTQFIELKGAVINIQRRFGANQKMKIEFLQYQALKKATLLLQNRFRAQKAMRYERSKFLELKRCTIITQRRFRANITMKIDYINYQKLRNAAIILQTRYKANKIMKIHQLKFLKLKQTVIYLQSRFRANCLMKKHVAEFQHIKCAAVVLQRKFRAIKIMKVELTKFQQLKKAIITIQRRFRANQLMKRYAVEFQQVRHSIIVVQQRFRANKAMQIGRNSYIELRKAVLTIQKRFRQNQVMKMEHSRYQNLKKASVIVQRRFRANRKMRIECHRFLELKRAVINVQRRFRANQQMKIANTEYKRMKNAAIVLQRNYRSRKTMKVEYDKFQNVKKSVLIIQERYRAYRCMKTERIKFQKIKQAAIVLQRKFRATKAMQIEKLVFIKLRKAVLMLQKQFRRLKETEKERKEFLEILKKKRTAALKIQTLWRGYYIRKQYPEIKKIRESVQEITSKAVAYDTLGNRRERAVQKLISDAPTLLQIIRALEDLEFITRRCRDTCVQMSRLLSEQLYITISSTNRSPAEMQACTVATSILINFCKYPPAYSSAWFPQYMDNIVTVMSHCCDKEEKLFSYLCTLLWIFAHNTEYKNVILSIPKCSQKFMKIKSLCLRKYKMVSLHQYKTASYFSTYSNLPEPSLLPDWGLDYLDRPRTFNNSVHGFNCVLKILDLS